MFKLEKIQYIPVKLYEIRKNVIIKNSLSQKDLRIWTATFF